MAYSWAYSFVTQKNKLFCRHGFDCQSPSNCSKHRLFGDHAALTEIKHVHCAMMRLSCGITYDFPCNFQFPVDQWLRVYIMLLNLKILPVYLMIYIYVYYCIATSQTCHNFVGGYPYFFRENPYQSVSFQHTPHKT